MAVALAAPVAVAGPSLTIPVYVEEDAAPMAKVKLGDIARTCPVLDSAIKVKLTPYDLTELAEIMYDKAKVETSVATGFMDVSPPGWLR